MTKTTEKKVMAAMEEYRRKYAEGKLSPRIVARLEAIPGWSWTEEPEHIDPKADSEGWTADIRTRYAAGTLPKWKIERLEQIPGWSWGAKRPTTGSIYIETERVQSNVSKGYLSGPHDTSVVTGYLHTDGTLPGMEQDEPLACQSEPDTTRRDCIDPPAQGFRSRAASDAHHSVPGWRQDRWSHALEVYAPRSVIAESMDPARSPHRRDYLRAINAKRSPTRSRLA